MRRRPPIPVVLLLLVLLAVSAAATPADAAKRRAKTAACPRLAYQAGTGGFYVLQPLTYRRRARALRVGFNYLDARGFPQVMVRTYRIRGGKVKIRAVREGKRGDGKVTSYRRSCAPDLKRAAKGRAGVYRITTSLAQRFVWKLPGQHRAPAAPSGGSVTPTPGPVVPAPAPPAPVAPAPGPPPAAPVPAPPVRSTATLLSAGDIAQCFNNVTGDPSKGQHPGAGAIATANLIRTLLPVDDLVAQGDLAYDNGTAAEFKDCYDPTWGAFKAFTHPAPGNHEYNSPGAAPYFAYWGDRAGPAGRGYYSYELGPWHVVSLNSESDIAANGQQATWLRADLAAHPSQCTLAFWHTARYSSDALVGNDPTLAPLFKILYDARVDVLLTGHAHNYERWNELGPGTGSAPTVEPGRGVRNFVVGTGGGDSTTVAAALVPGEQVAKSGVFGVLQMTLTTSGYTWRFVPAPPSTFTDAGTGTCH